MYKHVRKKEKPIRVATKTPTQIQKVQENDSYACHIYALNGHKMTDCPKFADVQKMFQGKNASISNGKVVVTANLNVVDVNVLTRRKIIKNQVFQEREPQNNKTLQKNMDFQKANLIKVSTLTKRYVHFDKKFGA